MEAVGKYDFDASSPNELSFRKGDVLKILSSNDAWYTAEMQGQEGFVPQNYLDVQIPRWFQEDASRSFAEEDLMTKAVGHFLIRGCQSSPGDFSISVRHEHDVQHFKVIKDNLGQYFLWSEKFSSFNRLVDFYKSTSISKQRLIFLKDGSEDSRAPTAHQNAGVVSVLEPTDQFEAAGRRSPLAGGEGPATAPQRMGPTQERQASMQVRPGSVQVRPGSVQVRPASVQVRPASVQVRPASVQVRPALAQVRPGSVQVRPGSVQVRPASAQVRPGSVQVRPASVQVRPGSVQVRPGSAQLKAAPALVRALFSFQVEEEDELGFCEGDVIEVLDRTDTLWWRGRLGERSGLFPANYTKPL